MVEGCIIGRVDDRCLNWRRFLDSSRGAPQDEMAPVAIESNPFTDSPRSLSTPDGKLKNPSLCDSLRTLPARWMRDESILELEKRAIFSKVRSSNIMRDFNWPLIAKVWLLTSHTAHFKKAGDYISGLQHRHHSYPWFVYDCSVGNYIYDYFIIRWVSAQDSLSYLYSRRQLWERINSGLELFKGKGGELRKKLIIVSAGPYSRNLSVYLTCCFFLFPLICPRQRNLDHGLVHEMSDICMFLLYAKL